MDAGVVRLNDGQWDALVETSPQGSVFNCREFLDALGTNSLRLGIVDGPDVLAGVAIQTDDRGTPVGPPDTFGYYQGILLSPGFDILPNHSRVRRKFEAVEGLLTALTTNYSELSLGLHWRFPDLRPLQWLNYHLPNAGRFELTPRYTGLLDLSPFADINAYVGSLGKGRRGDYRKARNGGIAVRPSDDPDILDCLHRLTFADRGADRGSLGHQLKPMAQAALEHGFGELLVASTPTGDPVSASLFIWDRTTSHYLFGASDPAHRDTGAATLVLVENVARTMHRGIRFIDVVGINSPQRGNFKTSFNAVPVPYFDARWRRPVNAGER